MRKFWIINEIAGGKADILLYGTIQENCTSDFIRELNELQKQYTAINVKINSVGGDVYDGFSIYQALKNSPCQIDTYVEGIAASMASLIAQGGRRRYISKYGRMMTHKPSGWGSGSSKDFRQTADELEAVERMMCAIYAAKSGKTMEECQSEFLNDQDNLFDAQSAVDAGLADEIYDGEPLVMPQAKTEKAIWESFNTQRFAAIFNPSQNPQNNMELKLSAQSQVALGISGNADNSQIDAAITALSTKAAKADNLQIQLTAAEKKVKDLENAGKTEKVKSILTGALKDKKITAEMQTQMEADYAENPDGLEKLIGAMKPIASITGSLHQNDGGDTKEFDGKSWDELDEKGLLPKLKAASENKFFDLFKSEFGKRHNEDKRTA